MLPPLSILLGDSAARGAKSAGIAIGPPPLPAPSKLGLDVGGVTNIGEPPAIGLAPKPALARLASACRIAVLSIQSSEASLPSGVCGLRDTARCPLRLADAGLPAAARGPASAPEFPLCCLRRASSDTGGGTGRDMSTHRILFFILINACIFTIKQLESGTSSRRLPCSLRAFSSCGTRSPLVRSS